MQHFLELTDWPGDRIEAMLTVAGELERAPVRRTLAGKVVGLLFMNPSLRTLVSMDAGVKQLGGDTTIISPGRNAWKLETEDGVVMDGEAAEHVREAIPVLGEYVDALAVRCFAAGKSLETDLADPVIKKMAALSPVPFISLESAVAHPCQALADWKTLDDLDVPRRGGRFVLSWAYHPKPLPYAVPASALRMALMRGMDVTVLRPDGYALPDPIMEGARGIARASGAHVRETSDIAEGMEGAHVLYAKSWAAPSRYGKPEEDSAFRANLRSWCVAESWFRTATPNASFMHCLPVRRNVKVADEVLDGPRSAVVRQAGNRLHVQKALLINLLSKSQP